MRESWKIFVEGWECCESRGTINKETGSLLESEWGGGGGEEGATCNSRRRVSCLEFVDSCTWRGEDKVKYFLPLKFDLLNTRLMWTRRTWNQNFVTLRNFSLCLCYPETVYTRASVALFNSRVIIKTRLNNFRVFNVSFLLKLFNIKWEIFSRGMLHKWTSFSCNSVGGASIGFSGKMTGWVSRDTQQHHPERRRWPESFASHTRPFTRSNLPSTFSLTRFKILKDIDD